jgi:RNA polymerase sigma-70 factor (ECF subfamily)
MLTDLMIPRSARIEMSSPESVDEPLLVARARAGDLDAFEMLYRANVGRVYALSLRLTGDAAAAAELTQDVFVHAWRRLSSFRGESALASWLHRITVNTLLMRVRAEKRRTSRVILAAQVDDEAEGADAARSEEGSIPPIDVAQAIDLERAIAALPPGARRVFVLHDVVGYRHEEIARMTGLAEGTLRAQLHRARRLLMEALKE